MSRIELPGRADVLEYEARGRVLEVRKLRGPRYFLKVLETGRVRFEDYADEARESIANFLNTGRLSQ